MSNLLSVLRRDFAAFEPQAFFEAGIPVYFVRLSVEVLEPQRLSSFQQYVLHAVSYEVNTSSAISRLLGVEERDLVSPCVSLLKLGYIQQTAPVRDHERVITLTESGSKIIRESGDPLIPKRKDGQFHFNALTWEPMPWQEKPWPVDRMVKEGLFILPAKRSQRPTLGDFSEQDVAIALSGAVAFRNCEFVALLQLKKLELEYIAPVTVVLLRHYETSEQRLAVYRNGALLRAESTAVQRLFEQQTLKLPADVASLKERDLQLPTSFPAEVAQAVQALVQNERALSTIEVQLAGKEAIRGTTQNEQERRELQERVQQLQEDLRAKQEANQQLQQELRQHHVEFLRTEEHRPLLEQALREAREEIIIISPWMNRRACNDYLCRLIGQAIARGVRIRIGYGMGKERDAAEADRNRSNVQQVRQALYRHIPKDRANLLEMKDTAGVHEKILVCDRRFAITSSFNWLSYLGQQDEEYRRETGTLVRHINQVADLAKIALQALSSK